MRIARIILKTIGWVLAGILFLVVIVLLAIQIPPVKKQIINIAEKQVNKVLNAELSIGKLSGNFFTNLQLKDILLTSETQDTIAFIPQIELRYKLLPLLKKNIVVKKIAIESPYVFLEQLSDSSWNLQHIAKPSEKEEDTTSTEFNMFIDLHQFALNNGLIRIESFNSQIPKQIRDLFIDLSGKYSTNDQEINLNKFQLATLEPDVQLQNLSIHAKGNKEHLKLDKLDLTTAFNHLSVEGEYYYNQIDKSSVELKTDPVQINEFGAFLPPSFHVQPQPIITLSAALENKHLSLDLQANDQGQGIDLKLSSYQLLEYLSDSTLLVNYDLALDISKIDLKYWLDNPEMKFLINGNLSAEGEGLNPQTMKAKLKGDFGDIMLYENAVNNLDISLNYNAGDVNGFIDGSGAFGHINITPDARQLLSDNPIYQLNINTRNLNIAPLIGNDTLTTDINLDADISGSGFDLKKINARGELALHPSVIMEIPIDTLGLNIDFIRQNIIIHSLLLKTLAAQLEASGNYNLQGDSDIELLASVDSVDAITKMFGIDSLETSLQLNAHLTGTPQNMQGELVLNIGETHYQGMQLDSLNALVNAEIQNNDILINGDILASRFAMEGIALDSIYLNVQTNTKDFDLKLNIGSEDIQTDFAGTINIGETIAAIISKLDLGYKGYNWKLDTDTSRIYIKPNAYEVYDFRLVSTNQSDSIQSIYLNGIINRSAEQDFRLNITNINTAEIARLFTPDQNINGLFNLELQVKGAAQSPLITGNLNMDGLSFQNYRFDTLKGNILYDKHKAGVQINIVPQDSGKVAVSGEIPAEIRLDSMIFNVQPQKNDSIAAEILISKFPLAIMNMFLPTDSTSGVIESDIRVNGTLGEPNISGNLNLSNGIVEMKTYGINYHNIQADINLSTEKINIDTFLIESKKGNMQAKGGVEFASGIYNADLRNSDLSITFNRFKPIDHKQYNIELSGGIDLSANTDSVRFSGDITIPETQVYLPAVMSLMGRSAAPDIPKPLLAKQLEQDSLLALPDSVIQLTLNDTLDVTGEPSLDLMKNLQGKLRVKIPRNMWIRNEDMRLELSGDIELVKQKEFFELFGSIDVVRGQYNLFGKVFKIETGIITFQGGEEINPLLNLEAIYTFRDSERNKKDLTLNVSGEAFSPEIKFTYEGQQISEGDALSYIMFGKNMDALTSGEQDNLTSGMDAEALAQMVASSIISSQLTKFLGNTFNVDYIEFSSNSSFDNASLTVGKYITNKLFVSYQQTIGHIDDKDVARYEMTMEYELFKFLFFQLTSSSITNGADLIFKVNSK